MYAAKTAGICLVLAGIMLTMFQIGCEKQNQVIETWERTFGGDSADAGRSVRQTSDGGFIIAGETRSQGAGRSDAWLVKTDSVGNELWNKTFGGPNPDGADAAQQTTDGGYVVFGSTWSFGAGGWDAWLIKTDATGNEVWSRTIGGTGHDYGSLGQQTSDGGYVMTGTTESFASDSNAAEVWLVKADANGAVSWVRNYGPGCGFSVRQTADGGYIITCALSQNNGDLVLIKTDSAGLMVWTLTMGGWDQDWGNSVEQTSDGGFVVAGFTRSFGAGSMDV